MKFNLTLILLGISFLFYTCVENNETRPPNIILIMADDLGYGDLGCYGNTRIKTPYLDRLAKNGLRFTDFHSNGAVCSPTRAALMTGLYQQKSGLEGVIYVKGETRKVGLDTAFTTMAEVFKSAGYATGMMGKWHLGYEKQYNPVHQGFDEFIGYLSGNIDYKSHYDNAGIYDWYDGLDSLAENGYVTDLIGKHAIDFARKNKDRPFFLYLPHEAPHVPFQGRNDPAFRYPDREFTYLGPVEDRERAYKDMVEAMDESIGLLLLSLESMQLLENTLIFFLSDNGGYQQYGDNGPLNGTKGTLYEGGHRVPAIAYWKGKIRPDVSDDLLMSFDLLPTLSSMANIEIDQQKFDGIDFSKRLFGEELGHERNLYWRYRGQRAIRSGDMKLLLTKSDTLLFDLNKDLGEKEDLSTTRPELLESLLNDYTSWDQEMNQYQLVTD
mgnify:CR=1 FL=1|tara:strand:+ start:2064 stop:3380 length:1317 start_codon:yes stop_codon:yes gene_type:complete